MPYLVLQIHYGDVTAFRGESARLHPDWASADVTRVLLLCRSPQGLLRSHLNHDLQPVSIPFSVSGLEPQQASPGQPAGGALVGRNLLVTRSSGANPPSRFHEDKRRPLLHG